MVLGDSIPNMQFVLDTWRVISKTQFDRNRVAPEMKLLLLFPEKTPVEILSVVDPIRQK